MDAETLREVQSWSVPAQVRDALEERDALRRRYTGNREECGHLRRFICGQGTLVEHCVICKVEAAERDAEELRSLVLRINKVCKHTLEGNRSGAWYKMVVFDIGQLTAEAQKEAD